MATAPIAKPAGQNAQKTFPMEVKASSDLTGTLDAAVTITLAADEDRPYVLGQVHYSYSAAPTGGGLTVSDGSGQTRFQIDITAAGPGSVTFTPPLTFSTNTALIVTLADPGGAVVGKLNLNAWLLS